MSDYGMVIASLREGMGLSLAYRWRAFSAQAADYDDARLLEVSIGSALLVRTVSLQKRMVRQFSMFDVACGEIAQSSF